MAFRAVSIVSFAFVTFRLVCRLNTLETHQKHNEQTTYTQIAPLPLNQLSIQLNHYIQYTSQQDSPRMKQFIVAQAATLVSHRLYAIQSVESSVMAKAHALV